jgi:hypothetical protein
MSAEPAAAMATASEPVPGAEERKIQASEAPSQTQPAPVVEEKTATEPAPAADEKNVEVPKAPSTTQPAPVAEENKAETSEAPPKAEPAPAVEKKVRLETPPSADNPLSQLFAELPEIIKEADYKEMWGVELSDASHVPTSIVLEKFIRANTKDVVKAKTQLIEALKWRKKMEPTKLLAETEFSAAKFGGLGYVTVYPKTESHEKEIVTWNIYGGVKDKQETFGNVEEYARYLVLVSSANSVSGSSNGELP